jgi:Tfp pilus assembly protein PilF
MNKANLARIIRLLLLIPALTLPSFAQGQNSIQGKVLLPNGASPPNPVKVTLTFNGMHVYETFTDLSGRFSFSGLRRGTYQLTAESDGQTFETTKVDAEVGAYMASPQSSTQNIQLRPKSGKSVPPAGLTSVEAVDPNMPQRAKQAYEKGVKQASGNKPEKALKLFQEAIEAYPRFYSAHVAMAEQYGKLQRDDEAIAAYQKAIELKADGAAAHVGLGVMFVKQKKYDEAIAPLRRSIELEKQSSTPYLFLGLAEMMTRDYKSSEANLLRAYEIGKPPIAHLYLANLYELMGEPAKAVERLKAFLKENPNLPETRQEEIHEAIEKLRKKAAGKK